MGARLVTIRDYDHERDRLALRDCLIELQDYERQFDLGKPEGSAMADAYLELMFDRCRKWHGKVFVADVGGRTVGLVCVWARVKSEEPDDDPSEYALVSDLVVGASYRRQGIGRKLLCGAEHYAPARGARSLRIRVLAHNAAARRLYTSAGFADSEIEMQKPLA